MTFRALIRRALPVQTSALSEVEPEDSVSEIIEEAEEELLEEEEENMKQTDKKPKAKRIEGVTEIPESSAYVAHLATYPALAAINGMLSSFPVVKIFTSNGIPLMMYMNENNEGEPGASKK